jgi:uncharacterized RDD family membrane protein YckC
MKCPKCGYLSFESGDRCRNCGYDFSLTAAPAELDVTLEREIEQPRPPLDLNRIIGGPEESAEDLPLFPSPQADAGRRSGSGWAEDAPLVAAASRPRAPLGVRRATPEVPRARPRSSRPIVALEDTLFEAPQAGRNDHAFKPARARMGSDQSPAPAPSRIMAGIVDVSLLLAVDSIVLYFTLRLCGLVPAQMFQLPLLPLTAFFLLLNGGYFVAFTAVGGQSIGKMALGIKVIAEEDGSVPIGRATVRTLAYLVSALPLGAGFLAGVLSADRLALHDRLAHTRVVRPSST